MQLGLAKKITDISFFIINPLLLFGPEFQVFTTYVPNKLTVSNNAKSVKTNMKVSSQIQHLNDLLACQIFWNGEDQPRERESQQNDVSPYQDLRNLILSIHKDIILQ